jgi:dipeptidyl aminopeptidase/acylaminoacyl peptidase
MNYSINDHIRLKRVSSIAASPDGTWLAVEVQRLDRDGAKYVGDIWKVPLNGVSPVQLTRGDTSDTSPRFRHDGALGFLSNRQPNEIKPDEDADKRMQLWIFPAEGGEPRQLTDEPLGVDSYLFAKNASRLVLCTGVIPGIEHDKQREFAADQVKKGAHARRFTQQPVRHWDHWLHENTDMSNTHFISYDVEDAAVLNRQDLTPDAKREFSIEPAFDISRDGTQLAVIQQTTGADRVLDSTILLIDIASKKQTPFGSGTNVNCESVLISPDGKSIATIRSTRSSRRVMRPRLTVIDIVSGAERVLADGWDRWPQLEAWTRDGNRLIVSADDNGDTPLFAIDRSTGEVKRITAVSTGGAHTHTEALADGRLACIRSTLVDAPECFVVDSAPDSIPRPLTSLSGFSSAVWAGVERCEARSTDGASIQYFFMKPKGATTPARPLPTLLWIHGGPIGMDADGWHWRWNPLLAVAAGYAVVLPNPRGSTGFGQEFIQGIWGNVWGGQCYADLMCVSDAVEARADVDSKRIMAMGGSFGGYMTNWIGTQTDRFRCLITHASIFTMAQFTGVTDHPAWWYLEMGGEDPFADQPKFDRFAPVKHIKNWKTPTLIIHGEHDYRCPISEGLNLFEALQYHSVPSELLIFPDENHWILKPKNAVAWYESVLEFIGRHMT